MNSADKLPQTPINELVDWKNPPTLAKLKRDKLAASLSYNVNKQKIDKWLDNLNVTGSAKPKTSAGSSSIAPKLIRKQAEWRYSSLAAPFLSKPNLFKVSPVSWEDRKAAQQNMLVLNHQFNNKINKVNFIDEYVHTAVDEGTVIVKVSWESQTIEVDKEVPNIIGFTEDTSMLPVYEELQALKESNPNEYNRTVPYELKEAFEFSIEKGIPLSPIVEGTKIIKETKTVKDQPCLEVCDYRNIIIDPNCLGDLSKADFIIYSYESSRGELRKDGRYVNLDSVGESEGINLLSVSDSDFDKHKTDFNTEDLTRKKIVVDEYWGYWDVNGDGVLVPFVCAWIGEVLIRLEKSPYSDGLPFVSEQYLLVRKSVYGEPDGALLEDNQRVVGAVTRGMIDVLGKSANGQTGFRKDALDSLNKKRYERGLDYEFNPTVNDPRAAVYMHTYPEIPQSAQFMLNLQNFEAEAITGVKSFSSGVSGDSLGQVAAGVRGALDAASKRELTILNRLKSGLVKIAKKIVAMNAEFLTEKEVIRITNEEFVSVDKDDLAGSFDLEIDITTIEEDETRASELAFMLQTIGPNEDPKVRRIVMAEIMRLRRMPDLAKKIEEYEPQPDPLAVKEQELKLLKLEAEIEQLQSTAQKNMASIPTEEAKARALHSKADMESLNFVEQESGVKQERELQRQGEQARANAQLERVKAEINNNQDNRKQLKDFLKS